MARPVDTHLRVEWDGGRLRVEFGAGEEGVTWLEWSGAREGVCRDFGMVLVGRLGGWWCEQGLWEWRGVDKRTGEGLQIGFRTG